MLESGDGHIFVDRRVIGENGRARQSEIVYFVESRHDDASGD